MEIGKFFFLAHEIVDLICHYLVFCHVLLSILCTSPWVSVMCSFGVFLADFWNWLLFQHPVNPSKDWASDLLMCHVTVLTSFLGDASSIAHAHIMFSFGGLYALSCHSLCFCRFLLTLMMPSSDSEKIHNHLLMHTAQFCFDGILFIYRTACGYTLIHYWKS